MNSNSLTLELYTRVDAIVSGPKKEAELLARRLSETGAIAGYTVHSWPSAVCADSESDVSRRYREFEAWADEAGVSIDSAFQCRTMENWTTGECREKLVTPLVCLAVRQAGDLVTVLPCTVDEGEHVSVTAYLDALARGDDPLGTLEKGFGSRSIPLPS